jgi:predicted DNA-binding transcriptional regulator YafY
MYTYQARIVLRAPRESVAERLPPLAGQLTPLDAEHCLLETGGHSLSTVAYYVALLGLEFQVLDPPELAAHVQDLAERLTRAASHQFPVELPPAPVRAGESS